MNSCIENTLCFQATMYDQMKPVTRKILNSLLWFEVQKRKGIFKEIFPSIKTIALHSKCSISSVKTSLNELDETFSNFILKRTRRSRLKSNLYILNERSYEFLYLLKFCRFTDHWKAVRMDVIRGLSEDENFLAEKLYRKGELSTMKLATSPLSKLATIKSLLLTKSLSETMRTEKESRTHVNNKNEEKRKEKGLIQDLPLSEKDKKWLSENYAYVDLRKARDDMEIYRFKWGKTIYNLGGFMNSQAYKNAKQRFGR